MRFRVQFTNGLWRLFDTHWYEEVAWYGLRKDAQTACDKANS
jgi:hypothetical protein